MSKLLERTAAQLASPTGAATGVEQITLKLKHAQIRTDGGTQMRAGVNEVTAGEYADEIRRGVEFPPVIVFHDGQDYWLADGFHRVRAYFMAGGHMAEIPCEVRPGTRREAVLWAAGANANHGLRRARADKERAVDALLADEEWGQWADREIARRCNVSPTFVGQRRKLVTVHMDSENGDGEPTERTYTTRHGTTATMNVAGQREAAQGRTEQRADNPPTDDEIEQAIIAWHTAELRRIGPTKTIPARTRWIRLICSIPSDFFAPGHLARSDLQRVIREKFGAWRDAAIRDGWQPTKEMERDRWWDAAPDDADDDDPATRHGTTATMNVSGQRQAVQEKVEKYAEVWALQHGVRAWLGKIGGSNDSRSAIQYCLDMRECSQDDRRWQYLISFLPAPHRKRDVIQALNNVIDHHRSSKSLPSAQERAPGHPATADDPRVLAVEKVLKGQPEAAITILDDLEQGRRGWYHDLILCYADDAEPEEWRRVAREVRRRAVWWPPAPPAIDPDDPDDADDDEPVMIACPRCGIEHRDMDGFGVIHCDACGHCTHPSITNGECDICGHATDDPPTQPVTRQLTPEETEAVIWRVLQRDGGEGLDEQKEELARRTRIEDYAHAINQGLEFNDQEFGLALLRVRKQLADKLVERWKSAPHVRRQREIQAEIEFWAGAQKRIERVGELTGKWTGPPSALGRAIGDVIRLLQEDVIE